MQSHIRKQLTGKRFAILGATQGMGQALSRELVQNGAHVFLLGHEDDVLRRSEQDLSARAQVDATFGRVSGFAHCDLRNPADFDAALATAQKSLGQLDGVIVTAAVFATQDALENDVELAGNLLAIDFTNTVLFCEAARKRLLSDASPTMRRTLCVFSSVAGERGRKPVGLYGAAKAGLSAYLEALDHKHHVSGLDVLTVKPGFVKTPMTHGLKAPPFAGTPAQVARDVCLALALRWPVLYTPLAWAPIMGAIRNLPRFVMRRINF